MLYLLRMDASARTTTPELPKAKNAFRVSLLTLIQLVIITKDVNVDLTLLLMDKELRSASLVSIMISTQCLMAMEVVNVLKALPMILQKQICAKINITSKESSISLCQNSLTAASTAFLRLSMIQVQELANASIDHFMISQAKDVSALVAFKG